MNIQEILEPTDSDFKIVRRIRELDISTTLDNGDEFQFWATGGPDEWDISFSINDSIDLTGGGNAYEVLSTAAAAIEIFKDECDPEVVTLESADDSRTRLYKRWMPRLFPGWEVETDTTQYRYGAVTLFTMTQ